MKKNAFYAQSGGVTSVINATAASVILESKKYKSKIGKVYAGKNGISRSTKRGINRHIKRKQICYQFS